MDEHLQKPDQLSIRKSAFGRTNLFLTSKSVLLREIKSSTSTFTRSSTSSIFHTHSSCTNDPIKSVCWHCCHEIPESVQPVRVPRLYDNVERVYHVYGWYCSPSCAKAYILEHSTFDRGYQMNVFLRMLREVHDIKDPVIEAPPRLALRMFGGPFDIDSFRHQHNVCGVVNPPFVSYCMLVEERLPMSEIGERSNVETVRGSVRGLRRPENGSKIHTADEIVTPPNESMYKKFLDSNARTIASDDGPVRSFEEPSSSTSSVAPKRQKKEKAPMEGKGLAKFMCK